MEGDESLYALFNEVVNKRKQLVVINEEIKFSELKYKCNIVNQKLASLKKSLNVIVDSQEKINSKRAVTVLKLQRNNASAFEKENILLIPQQYHKDLKNIIANKAKIENLMCTLHTSDNYETIDKCVIESQNLISVLSKQYAKDINFFKSSEGLYKNVLLIKTLPTVLDKSFLEETQSDSGESDLGCCPHDNNSIEGKCSSIETSNGWTKVSSFLTSSPINKPTVENDLLLN